jgi:hypothetical protein
MLWKFVMILKKLLYRKLWKLSVLWLWVTMLFQTQVKEIIRLSGYIGNMQVLIQVDSRSVGSFISFAIANKLKT